MRLSAQELLQTIVTVIAVESTSPKGRTSYQIKAFLENGESIVLKKKSTRAPTAVQLYDRAGVNGNAPIESEGTFFLFAKNIESWYREEHLKTYPVVVMPKNPEPKEPTPTTTPDQNPALTDLNKEQCVALSERGHQAEAISEMVGAPVADVIAYLDSLDATLTVENEGEKCRTLIANIIDEIDFLRACKEAGGDHEHAFWLMVDSDELAIADAKISGIAESIRQELERNLEAGA